MVTSGLYQLRDDVLILAANEVSDATSELIDLTEDEFVLTVRRGRQSSRVIDHATVTLLHEFVEPTSVVHAVIAAAETLSESPRELMTDAYELVSVLVGEGVLVETSAESDTHLGPRYQEGDEVAGCRIVRCVHQIDDTEVYQVDRGEAGHGALKLVPSQSTAAEALQREQLALERMSSVPPKLLSAGTFEDRDYLLIEWIDGRSIAQEASLLAGDTEAILQMVVALIEAYDRLHRGGIIHGDVHANNVLVMADGTIRLLDFGFSYAIGDAPPARAGVVYYFEPEMAAALLAGHRPPGATVASDQYALASLCWLLVTGAHSQTFSVVRDEMLREIAEREPLRFADAGVKGIDELEAVLLKALRKDPAARFRDLADFLSAARAAVYQLADSLAERALSTYDAVAWLRKLGLAEPASAALDLEPPTASVNYGAAGVAHAMLRIAQRVGSGELLSQAHSWLHRAKTDMTSVEGFANPAIDISSATVGQVTPYHTVAGIHTVQALAGAASGDFQEATSAVALFVESSRSDEKLDPDLTLGSSGTLLAGSLLLGLDVAAGIDVDQVRLLGADIAKRIWEDLVHEASIATSTKRAHLGIAHGWAGYLYAQLMWCEASGSQAPVGLVERLDELILLGEDQSGGLRWPWFNSTGVGHYMAGWCNGTAGHLLLLLRAADTLADDSYVEVALRAGRSLTLEATGEHSLCCGHAGIGFALLGLYRASSDEQWLAAARTQAQLGERSFARKPMVSSSMALSYSLYKGALGIALLADALAQPEIGAMPFFEFEPWLVR